MAIAATPVTMPPHPFDKHWYVHLDEKTYGPYTGHDIRRLVGEGKIVESDFVYSEGGSQWVQAQNDPILRTLFIKPDTNPFRSPPPSQIKFLQRHWAKISIGVLVVLIIGWIAWPYYAIYDLMNGVRDGDVSVLENRVAWDSVRQALRGDLNAFFLETIKSDAGTKGSGAALGSGLATLFGPAVINQMIDAYVTPQAVAAINRTKNSTAATEIDSPSSTSGQAVSSTAIRRLDWDQVRYAFFSGGPFTFRVDLMPKIDPPPHHPTTLIFKWVGTWQLTRIAPPEDMFDRIKQTNTLASQLDKNAQPSSSISADVSSNPNTPPKTDAKKADTAESMNSCMAIKEALDAWACGLRVRAKGKGTSGKILSKYWTVNYDSSKLNDFRNQIIFGVPFETNARVEKVEVSNFFHPPFLLLGCQERREGVMIELNQSDFSLEDRLKVQYRLDKQPAKDIWFSHSGNSYFVRGPDARNFMNEIANAQQIYIRLATREMIEATYITEGLAEGVQELHAACTKK